MSGAATDFSPLGTDLQSAIEPVGPPALWSRRLEDELHRVRSALVCSLVTLVDLKDLATGVHSTRLAQWAIRVAKRLGLDEEEVRDVEVAALLHDIGKLGVPDSILLKQTPLTEGEFREIRLHPDPD